MKKLLFVALIGLFLGGCTVATDKPSYDFVDYGTNESTNEMLVAKDGESVAWVFQELVDDGIKNVIFSTDKKGENKEEIFSIILKEGNDIRLMGYYPETKSFIYVIEYKNTEFGPEIQREAFYKFFDEQDAQRIGKNYLSFFETDKGVMGLRVGSTVSYYQFSMTNTYAIDSIINYNQDKKTPSLFTDALMTENQEKIVYVHAYDPATQGLNQNKVLTSDLYGENRKELVSSAEAIELIEFVDEDTVKIKIGEETKEFDF
jgi:hypothetical protein